MNYWIMILKNLQHGKISIPKALRKESTILFQTNLQISVLAVIIEKMLMKERQYCNETEKTR